MLKVKDAFKIDHFVSDDYKIKKKQIRISTNYQKLLLHAEYSPFQFPPLKYIWDGGKRSLQLLWLKLIGDIFHKVLYTLWIWFFFAPISRVH